MAENAQCSEDGPFFPTTPRYLIQNGMSLDPDILQSPDWIVIVVLLACILLIMILLIVALVGSAILCLFVVNYC